MSKSKTLYFFSVYLHEQKSIVTKRNNGIYAIFSSKNRKMHYLVKGRSGYEPRPIRKNRAAILLTFSPGQPNPACHKIPTLCPTGRSQGSGIHTSQHRTPTEVRLRPHLSNVADIRCARSLPNDLTKPAALRAMVIFAIDALIRLAVLCCVIGSINHADKSVP